MRSMGDAIGVNALLLAHVGTDMVGGYVTGDGDVPWSPADWAMFAGKVAITIDQGAHGSPVPTAIVRDVEPGAWTAAGAVNRAGWTAARPTIYCDRSDLATVLACGWRGDLWLAYPGWQPGQPLPVAPGCTYVAVQNQQNVAGAYDLSVVLNDTWPYPLPAPQPPAAKGQDMIILQVTAPAGHAWAGTRTYLYAPGAAPQHIVSVPDNQAFEKVLPVAVVSWEQFTGLGGS